MSKAASRSYSIEMTLAVRYIMGLCNVFQKLDWGCGQPSVFGFGLITT